MSLRPNEYPRSSAALAGLGLTTQLAAAATDSIPIAKLVLGVVSRIITLAEDIETSRDALHQLAESARTMGLSISVVVAGRKMSPEVGRRLEAIYEVLRSIETLFKRHKAKSALHKAISYAFTTKKHVESLSQELSRATQDLLCIAVVETNAQVRENAAYIGEFRHIRLCDVDELTLISEHQIFLTGYSSQIYSGKVKGRLVALRCFERHSPSDEESYWFENFRQETIEHDQLLEKLSTVPNLHRNIARLYGKNSGEHFDRFNVVSSLRTPSVIGAFGMIDAPAHGAGSCAISKFNERPVTIDATWNITSQLMDTACWLKDRGLSWDPATYDAVFIDHTGAPIIGLHNDLCSQDRKHWHIHVLGNMLEHAYSAHWNHSRPSGHALDIFFGTALVPEGIYREKITVPRRLIATLDAKISTYIRNALQCFRDPFELWAYTGAVILHVAASGCNIGSTFYTKYITNSLGHPFEDRIFITSVNESDDELVHRIVVTDVQTSMAETLRKKLGITVEGSPNHTDILESFGNPAEPASMRFTTRYPRRSA